MAKRKLEDETLIADDDCPISECYARMSKHRSCWKHMLVSLAIHGRKIKKTQEQELRSYELISECFLGICPTRQRSQRRIKSRYTIARVIKEQKKKKLHSGEFDCYFQNLWKSLSEDKRTYFTCLDSMWFALYLKAPYKRKVLDWIKREHIFSKKYVFVPIVCWGHWSLLIFCHLGETFKSNGRTPCMLLLDSLETANPRRLEPDIRKFVLDIYRSEGKAENRKFISQIPLLVPKVPQQRNGEECGNYVLYFINLFLQRAPDDFNIKEYPYFMNKNWFHPECLEHFFEKLGK